MAGKTRKAKSAMLREKNPPVDDPRQAMAEGEPTVTGRGTGGRMIDRGRSESRKADSGVKSQSRGKTRSAAKPGTKTAADRSRPRKGR
jgi:hypothetical protein